MIGSDMILMRRIKQRLESISFMQSKENWSFYRFSVFFFSIQGQKRIFRFGIKILRFLWRELTGGKSHAQIMFDKWRERNMPDEKQLHRFSQKAKIFDYRPLISVIVPTYKPNLEYFKATVASVKNQAYQNWQLCIADDHSQDEALSNYLKEIALEQKINFIARKKYGQISACTNSALSIAEGEFVAFLDQNDILNEDALYQIVERINQDRNIDLIYSDEDKIDENGKFVEHHFKPDWSPDNLLSRNYIGHLIVIRKKIVDQIDGFRLGFEGGQDLDFLLRAVEKCKNIQHIHKILYHLRKQKDIGSLSSTAKNNVIKIEKKAVEEAHQRRGNKVKVHIDQGKEGFYRTEYHLIGTPTVSIIIPTKNNADVLATCLNSIFKLTDYPHFEVLLLDNNSDEQSLFDLINIWETKEKVRFKSRKMSFPFNFAKLMNEGAKIAKGEFLLLLNNDTEVISSDWLHNMLQHAQRKEIGAVGVKLLYPNDTIQHAGVIIGMGAAAGHLMVGKKKSDKGYYSNLITVNNYSAVTAACLMVSKNKYLEVEGFDEELAVDYNDIDFCLKLHKAGYLNLWTPEVTLYHYESLSRGHPHATRESFKRSRKEIKYFKDKWKSYIDYDPYFNQNFTKDTANYDLLI